jgi:transposase-like protein
MTKTQVEVITSVQRRRSWSRAEKERIVAAAMEPGAVASEVARAAGENGMRAPSLLKVCGVAN